MHHNVTTRFNDRSATEGADALEHATKIFQAWFAGASTAERDQFWHRVSDGGGGVLQTGIPVDVAARLHANAAVPPLGLLRGLACRDAAMKLQLGGQDLHALNDNYQDAGLLVPEDAALLGKARFIRLLPHPCQDTALGIVANKARVVGSGDEWTGMIQQLLEHTTRAHGGLVVDVGANLGQYTLGSAALGHRVISLEVQTRRYQQIATSLFANGWLGSRATAINAAVGAPSDEGSFLKCSRHGKNHSVVEYGPCAKLDGNAAMAARSAGLANADLVPFTTIDALVPSPTEVDFLKIDCDGCEGAAYQGYRRLLAEGRVRHVLVETVAAAWLTERGGLRDAAWLTELVTKYRPTSVHLAKTQSWGVFPKMGTGCLAGLGERSSLATALHSVLRAAAPSTGWQHQRAWVQQLAQGGSGERLLASNELRDFFSMTARCAAASPDRIVSFDVLLEFKRQRRSRTDL